MNGLIHVAGWTLLHFAWQGLLIALAASAALWLLRRASSHSRYLVACGALAAMLAAPVITARVLSVPSRADQSSAASRPTSSTEAVVSSSTRIAAAERELRETSGPTGIDTLLPFVVAMWVSGVMFLLTRLAGGWWRVRSRHHSALRMGVSRWQNAGTRISSLLGIRRPVVFVDSPDIDTPTVIGWLRPIVLLPIAALTNLTPAQVEAILAHELAHIRRHDYLVNLLQNVAETLLFYHPAVWWISARIRVEREHCCDEIAVEMCGDPVGYVSALAELETWRTAPTTLALAATGGALLERVRRVLRVPIDDEWRASNALVTAVLVLLIVIAGGSKQLRSLTAATAPRPQVAQTSARTDWQRYETPHFDVLYTQRLGADLEGIERQAEGAYARVWSDLGHDLSFRPVLVLFGTQRDLEQGFRDRDFPQDAEHILASLEEPGRLAGDLTHEITHSFFFDILPRRVTATLPVWVLEGLAEYQRGEWDASEQTAVMDLVRRNAIPRMSLLTPSSFSETPRLNYGLGHAAFEYIVSRWPNDGVRRLLSSLRQAAPADGLDSTLAAAFGLSPGDFDRGFENYVKTRFADRQAAPSPQLTRLQGLMYDLRLGVARDALRARAAAGALESQPTFEVVSVKRNSSAQGMNLLMQPGGRFVASGATLRALVLTTYGLQEQQLEGGPAWIRTDRFDIEAKDIGNSALPQRAAMLKTLLADRFKLKVHTEMRALPVYALVLAKSDGSLGRELRLGSTDTCTPQSAPPSSGTFTCGMVRFGAGHATARSALLSQLIGVLSGAVDRTVVDQTGLTGTFDFDLEWTPDGPSIFSALQEQLGLKLEARRQPLEIVVIDSIQRPSEN